MKNFMSKIKEMNYKEFAVNHGEKIVLCFIALFVVFAIFTTKWTTEKRTPSELSQKVAASQNQVNNSQWPEDQRKEFLKVDNLNEKATKLLAGVESKPYEFTTHPSPPIYTKKEKAKEIDFLPIEELIAQYGRVIMETRPIETAMEGELDGPDSESGETGESKSDKEERTGFERRTGAAGAMGPGGAALAGLTFGAMANPAEMGMIAGNPDAAMADPSLAQPGAFPEGAFPGAGMDGMQGPTTEGRGVRFIAVRGVFDLATQLNKLERALGDSHSMQNMQTQNLFDLLDFELERKTLIPGKDPASSEWVKLDIESSMEILRESASYDPDVVNTNITHNVITTPLPSRIAGFWYKLATHPRVENFTLSQEEIEQEVELNTRMLEQYKKTHAGEKVFKEKQRGFSRLQIDMRGIRNSMMAGQPEEMEAVFAGAVDDIQAGGVGKPMDEKELIQKLKENANAAGRLILFRYFDFDLTPGETYQYRVRLVVRNPNYGRPIEQVELPSVAEGETRTTPWSNETAAVNVKKDVHYYLQSVRPPRGNNGTTAKFEIFQWYPETGTTVHSVLSTSIGEEVGKEVTTELYDVAKVNYDDKAKVTFDTQNYLVDATPTPTIRLDEHPDLNLSSKTRGIVPIDAEAILVDNFGNLKQSLPPAASASYKQVKNGLDRERKALEWVKEETEARSAAPLEGGLEAGLDAALIPGAFGPEAEAFGPAKKGKKGRRKKSPIRVPVGP